MGKVISFPSTKREADMLPPRLLLLCDKALRPSIVREAHRYVIERIVDAPAPLLGALQSIDVCLTCQLLPAPHEPHILHDLAKSKNIRIVAVMCLMEYPPRGKIEQLFPRAQIFFEEASCLRGLVLLTNASH